MAAPKREYVVRRRSGDGPAFALGYFVPQGNGCTTFAVVVYGDDRIELASLAVDMNDGKAEVRSAWPDRVDC